MTKNELQVLPPKKSLVGYMEGSTCYIDCKGTKYNFRDLNRFTEDSADTYKLFNILNGLSVLDTINNLLLSGAVTYTKGKIHFEGA